VITLTSVKQINASPEKVWHFLTHLHESDAYKQWHPKDHIAFRLRRGDGQSVGSTFTAVEMLGRKKFSLNYRLSHAEPQQYLAYGATGLLRPLNLASGSFTLAPISKNQTEFVAKIHIGYTLPIIDWLVHMFVDIKALTKHMDEEGEYLNQALKTKEG